MHVYKIKQQKNKIKQQIWLPLLSVVTKGLVLKHGNSH